MAQNWSVAAEVGGDSDHALITTLIIIKHPQFIPKKQQNCKQWEAFQKVMKEPATLNYSTAEGTLVAAAKVDQRLQRAMNS